MNDEGGIVHEFCDPDTDGKTEKKLTGMPKTVFFDWTTSPSDLDMIAVFATGELEEWSALYEERVMG